jgi:peptidyl-prolyl cis-trans isomerase SurA
LNKKVHSAYRIVLIILSLGFLFNSASYSAVLLDRVVAVVNKEVITWSELYKTMEYESAEQVKQMSDGERAKIFKENEAEFLDRLIDMRLQIQEANNLGLTVSAEEVAEAVGNIKKKYSLTDKSFEESLRKEGMTFDEYKKKLSDQMLISQYINKQIRQKVVVSGEDVNKYLEASGERAIADEAFRLKQIFMKIPKDEQGRTLVEEKAAVIMERLRAGEDFSSLAKEYSEDASAKLGGDLGSVKKNQMAKEFIDVLSSMKAGDVSRPFWTGTGLHIIKLEENVSARTMDEMRETIRKRLTEEQFSEKYKSWLKALREKARIEIRL